MKARIINGIDFGGVHPLEWINNNQNIEIGGQLVSEWTLTEVLPNEDIIKPEWNGSQWVESYIEVIEVPKSISRMKFIIQIFLTTQIKYEDIVLFITNLNFDEAQKYVILTRLRSATHFDRNSSDLAMIAQMMGITSEQLDEIFINGNLLN
jgi:hypothetical protein